MRHQALPPAMLEALWRVLTTCRSPRPTAAANIEHRLLANRFVTESEFEDLLCAYGVPWRGHELPWERILACFDVSLTTSFFWPSGRGKSAVGFQSLAFMDALHVLISLENLGLPLDLHSLVDSALARLGTVPKLSASELSVLWYQRDRGKWPPLRLASIAGTSDADLVEQKQRTVHGHVSIWRNAAGVAAFLEARCRRHRRPRPTMFETCSVCGAEYLRGDVDSTDAHRREHASRMRVLLPKPHARLLATAGVVPALRVTSSSPRWLHREMHDRARAFKREFRYDFTQWESATGESDPHVQGFLFVLPDARIVGTCAFRWREQPSGSRWALQWIWIAPEHRRQGLLRMHWPEFRREFGTFCVEAPVSDAMMSFLHRMGDSELAE